MLSVKMACSLLEAFFRLEVDSDVKMPQAGLCYRRTGTMCGVISPGQLMLGVKMACSLLKAFFRPEVDSDVNMPQAGLC